MSAGFITVCQKNQNWARHWWIETRQSILCSDSMACMKIEWRIPKYHTHTDTVTSWPPVGAKDFYTQNENKQVLEKLDSKSTQYTNDSGMLCYALSCYLIRFFSTGFSESGTVILTYYSVTLTWATKIPLSNVSSDFLAMIWIDRTCIWTSVLR